MNGKHGAYEGPMPLSPADTQIPTDPTCQALEFQNSRSGKGDLMSNRVRRITRGFKLLMGLLSLCAVASCSDSPNSPAAGATSAAWLSRNPLPQGNRLNDCDGTASGNGLAVGDGGTILRTSDSGANLGVVRQRHNQPTPLRGDVARRRGCRIGGRRPGPPLG